MATTKKRPTRGGKREGAGRPLGSGEFDRLLSVNVSAELIERIDTAAVAAGISRAAWVREALERALRSRP